MEKPLPYSTTKLWNLNLHIVITNYIFLYTLGVFNPSQENISASLKWGSNKNDYVTIFSALIPIGGLVGTLLTVPLINRFGRRGTLILNDICYIIGSLILVMPSTPTFGIGRFVTGFSAGIFMTVGPIYVSEVTPEAMIRKIGPSIVISASVGLMTAYGLGLVLPTSDYENDPLNYWWIFMFLFPALVCFYQFCYFKFFCLYDTPQYYMAKGLEEKVKLALQLVYNEQGLDEGIKRIFTEHQGKFGASQKRPSLAYYFTNKKFRKMIRVGFLLCILNQLSGMAAIIFYSTQIFSQLGGLFLVC